MDYNGITLVKSYLSNIGLVSYEVTSIHVLCCRISKREALVRKDGAWSIKTHDIDNRNTILISAAYRGHVHTLSFLRETMTLTKDEFRIQDNQMIRGASINGHVGVLKFLYHDVKLNISDFRSCENAAICYAARNGHRDVLQFLYHDVKLSISDFRSYCNHPLRVALHNGHINILKFLYHVVGLRAPDFRMIGTFYSRDGRVLVFLRGTVNVKFRYSDSLYIIL